MKPGEQIVYPVKFLPRNAGEFSGRILLDIANGDQRLLAIRVHGTGVHGACEVSAMALEFGSTSIDSRAEMTFSVLNYSLKSFDATVDPIFVSDDSAAFAFGDGFSSGKHPVPAATADGMPGVVAIPVVFRPLRSGPYSGTLAVASTSDCPSPITLHGVGVFDAFECLPAVDVDGTQVCRVDFGFLYPGAKAIKPITFRNLGKKDIRLTLVGIQQPPVEDAPFAIESDDRVFTIAAGGGATSIGLSFFPHDLGEQRGTLTFASDDPNRPSGTVDLIGVGGGPKIDAQPSQIDFGKVAVDTYQVRRITIANVGTNVPGTTDDNLILAVRDGAGWTERRPEFTGPDAADFSFVEWPPQGYSAVGLSEGQSADLHVRFAPATAGSRNATLIIYSNDITTPVIYVALTGIAVDLPGCDFTIEPPSLDFGDVASNKYLTLSFAIENRDPNPTHECFVSMLDLTRITYQGGAFALVNGPLDSATIGGGKTLSVAVRFQPKTDGTYSGEVEFFISSPTRSNVKVSLAGVASPECLMIAPRELDFGTIGINCNSRQRFFTMYNTCSNAVTVTAIDMQQGPSAEFAVTRKPALPVTIAGGASSDFGVTYHPVDAGEDTGTVAVTISGKVNPYIVPLTGTGTTDSSCP